MSFLEPPSVDWRETSRPADDLDGLLRAFFRAELPRPWPAFRYASTPTNRPGRWVLFRSRIVLAASLALLLGGEALLSGRFLDRAPIGLHLDENSATADTRNRQPVISREELVQDKDGTSLNIRVEEQPASR